jgi:hypothetical protein
MKFGWIAWLRNGICRARRSNFGCASPINPLSRREALDALFEIYRASNDLPNLYLTAMRLHETSPEEPLIAAE